MKESLVYSIPFGVYLLVVSQYEKRRQSSYYDLIEYAALGVLLLGTYTKTGGSRGFTYALIMGLEGLLISAFGISQNDKKFTYAGGAFVFLAVLSQTWEYITSLPQWIITSITGLALLGIGVYLLWKRYEKEEEKENHDTSEGLPPPQV